MREIRQSGSEGGGIEHIDPPYPYRARPWCAVGPCRPDHNAAATSSRQK
jgi:hypothetical protein